MLKSHVAIISVSALAVLTSCIGISERVVEPVAEAAVQLQPSVRSKQDLPRGRRWELGWGSVAAYDMATNRPIRRVALEGASQVSARGVCQPDMIFDRFGAVLVSSNTQPVLWRVSPERFEVERYDIRVEDERGREVGFSSLAWGVDGRTLMARDASTNGQWRIDLATLRASRLETDAVASGAC